MDKIQKNIKEDLQTANKHEKMRFSTSLVFREMKMKIQ